MSTEIVKMEESEQRKRVRREMKDLVGSIELSKLSTGVKAKAFWNIQRHKLYEGLGYSDMKSFCEGEGFGYSERQIRRYVAQGDEIAAAVFPGHATAADAYLTGKHVKDFVDAQLHMRSIAGTTGQLLLPASLDDAVALIDAGDNVNAIAREIAKRKRRERVADDGPPPRDNRKMTKEQIENTRRFCKKYRSNRVLKSRRSFIEVMFDGGRDMLREFDMLDELEQEAVTDAAINIVLELR